MPAAPGFLPETIPEYRRVAALRTLQDRPAADCPNRSRGHNDRESTAPNPPAQPSSPGPADPLLRCPYLRSLLYPTARPRGPAWWPVPAGPLNRAAPGKSPCRRNAAPDDGASLAGPPPVHEISVHACRKDPAPLRGTAFQVCRRSPPSPTEAPTSTT